MYTHLEDYIYNLLRSIKITDPSQLTMDNVVKRMKLTVVYKKKAYRVYDEIILMKGTEQQEWQLFAHELCHHLRHSGSQFDMHYLFRILQEWQANYFSYHFCVPTFMLDEIKEVTVCEIMNLFNVEEEFAYRRLEMYQNKFYGVMNYERASY